MVAKKTPRRKPSQRNPSARKYRVRQYDVAEWNVRAQRWEPLGRVSATTPKYAIEEFMASRPGYSRLHLRAEEAGASTAKRRNPDRAITVADARVLGVKFGRAAAVVERRQDRESARDERRTPAEFASAVEELAFWELGESGHPASWDIQHRTSLQRAFYAGARSAAKAPATKRSAKQRNPLLSAPEARESLRAEIREWGTSREDMPVGLWTPIAKAAKVSASEMRGVAEVASAAAYNARHGQTAPRAAMQARREIAEALIAQVDAATDAQVLAYVRARSRFIEK